MLLLDLDKPNYDLRVAAEKYGVNLADEDIKEELENITQKFLKEIKKFMK